MADQLYKVGIEVRGVRIEAQICADAEDYIARRLGGGAFYEPDLLRAIRPYLYPDRIALDVGAHVGNHSAFMAHFGPVVAFECDPRSFERWNTTISASSPPHHVRLIRAPVAAERGLPVELIERSTNTGATSIKVRPGAPATGAKTTTTIDAQARGLSGPIGFIKMDIEGGEADALRGALETLRRDRPALSVECHTEAHLAEIERILAETGLGYVRRGRYCATPTYLFDARGSARPG